MSFLQSSDFEQGVPPWIREHIKQNQSLQALAARAYRKGGSFATVKGYAQDVIMLSAYLGGRTEVEGKMVLNRKPDELIADRSIDWTKALNGWLDALILKGNAAPASAHRHIWGARRWLDVNDVAFDAKKVELPKLFEKESHAIPGRPELRQMMDSANLPEKVLALVGLSTGLRMGSILSLKLKDVDLSKELPIVVPPPKETKGKAKHFSFMTPEAKRLLLQYLEERRMNGEELGPESPLIVNMKLRGKRVKGGSAARRWLNVLEKADLDQKGAGGTWHMRHFHTLRKYTSTWMALSGVEHQSGEFFLGHRSSISQRYFGGTVGQIPADLLEQLEKEYRKAVPALSVLSDEKEIKQLEGVIASQAKELEQQKATYEALAKELREEMAAIKSAYEKRGRGKLTSSI